MQIMERPSKILDTESFLADQIMRVAYPIKSYEDLDRIIDRIGDARYVLLGEASHGTSEYYIWRARLSQRLIQDQGFSFIAVEGDWPDCYSINRYVKSYPNSGKSAREVLEVFERWPTWMWANWEIAALIEWLKKFNSNIDDNRKVGFYGLDVYSLWDSMYAIINYLKDIDPQATETAKKALRCFEPYGEEPQGYAWAVSFTPASCENDVIKLLQEIRNRIKQYPGDREANFNVEQNALIAVDAERYYRAMVRADAGSWNIRDYHMAYTLDRLMQFHGSDARCIVWEHNTHIGDARATDMAESGEVNVGQLIRERHGKENVVLVGFSGYQGNVIAGREWDAPMEKMKVPPGEDGSWEDILHRSSMQDKIVILQDIEGLSEANEPRGHRAIGVVYHPQFERYGNYVPTVLPKRYDAFMFFDNTQALHPLHIQPVERREPPETYPWGI